MAAEDAMHRSARNPAELAHCSFACQGVSTELASYEYEDRLCIFVSQQGRLGTIILVSRHDRSTSSGASALPSHAALQELENGSESLEDHGLEQQPPGPVFNVSVLLGKRDEPMLGACARAIAQGLSDRGQQKPVLVSLGLQDHSMGMLKEIAQAVLENIPTK